MQLLITASLPGASGRSGGMVGSVIEWTFPCGWASAACAPPIDAKARAPAAAARVIKACFIKIPLLSRFLSDRHIELLDDVAGVAAAVPLTARLQLAGVVGRAALERVLPGRLGLPGEAPAPPGVLAQVRVQAGLGPGLAVVDRHLDLGNPLAGV